MRYIYLLLILIAGIAFALGCVQNMVGFSAWFTPGALWRFTVGALGFAIVFVLLDLRDILASQNK